jgi:hypothetical protein
MAQIKLKDWERNMLECHHIVVACRQTLGLKRATKAAKAEARRMLRSVGLEP